MPDLVLSPRSPLDGMIAPGYHGAIDDAPGVIITLRPDLSLAGVMARKGNTAGLCARIRDVFGVDLPLTPRRAAATAVDFIWAGPGRWLAATSGQAPASFEAGLRTALSGLASVTNQSDGRCIVSVTGPRAREMLAKGLPLDLDPRAFGTGDAALTIVGHVAVHFWQRDAIPSYDFAVFRSFTASFCEWLIDAAAEFGAKIDSLGGNTI